MFSFTQVGATPRKNVIRPEQCDLRRVYGTLDPVFDNKAKSFAVGMMVLASHYSKRTKMGKCTAEVTTLIAPRCFYEFSKYLVNSGYIGVSARRSDCYQDNLFDRSFDLFSPF